MSTFWRRPTVRLAIPWFWMAVIFWFSAQSRLPDLTPGLPGFEAVAGHLVCYGVLAGLWWWAFRGVGVAHPALLALLFAVFYGLSDEYHQSFVPNRTPSVFDLTVDTAGASAVLLAIRTRRK